MTKISGTREVQLEVTLDVTVTCSFRDGAWNLDSIDGIKGVPDFADKFTLNEYLWLHHAERLAELFEQQEP